jgi:hypothetical protein
MSRSITVLVCGKISRAPEQPGAVWTILHYLLGFRALGHTVYFVEPFAESEATSPPGALDALDEGRFFHSIVSRFGLEACSGLVNLHTGESVGLGPSELKAIVERCDILVNVGGALAIEEPFDRIPVRVYLDLDPVFTQLWKRQGLTLNLEGHTEFVTVGLNLGTPRCSLVSNGIAWKRTLQPVLLPVWIPAPALVPAPISTIANWRSYGSIIDRGTLYGQKAHSWRSLIDLPQRSDQRFHVALTIHDQEKDDLKRLQSSGWILLDPKQVAATLGSYRRFIQTSLAELAIAKSGYVVARSGWFSERSTSYLASGKPVVAQATGFEDHLPCGQGLFSFESGEEALEALKEVTSDYLTHSRAARRIAEEYFDSRLVLSSFLRLVGVTG